MKNYLISIIILAAAYLLMPQAAYSQSDSDLVWIKENAYVGYVTHMDLSPDGSKVLISNYYKDISTIDGIYIYDVETGNLVDSIIGVGSIGGFSPDKRYIYTFIKKSKGIGVKKIDLETHEVIKYSGQIDTGIHTDMCVLPDGRIVLSAVGGNNLLYILDGISLAVLDSVPKDPDYCGGVDKMCLSTVGNLMALMQSCRKSFNIPPINIVDINIWDINTKRKLKKLPLKVNDGPIYGMSFFPDGYRIAILKDGVVNVVDINNNDTIKIKNDGDIVSKFCFSQLTQNFYVGTYTPPGPSPRGIFILNSDNLNFICKTALYPNYSCGDFILSQDEKYLISADPAKGALMKLRNCYYTTEIPEDSRISTDKIFPNPGTDTFTLLSTKLINKVYQYEIADNSGNIIKNDKIQITDGKGSFSVMGIPQGTYFLLISSPKDFFVNKFIIER